MNDSLGLYPSPLGNLRTGFSAGSAARPGPWRQRAGIGATVGLLHVLVLLALAPAHRAAPPPRPLLVTVVAAAESPTPSAPPAASPPPPTPSRPTSAPVAPHAPSQPRTVAQATMPSAQASSPTESAPTPAAPAAPAAPASPRNTAAAPATGGDEAPPRFEAAYLHNPQPPYPLMSRKLKEEGQVRLRVLVNASGRAESVTVHVSSTYPRLDEAARTTVHGWQFVPAQRGGQAIAGWVEVPIQFNLEK